MTIRELSPDETGLAYDAMIELRPQIGSAALLDWLLAEARGQRCDEFHLDSGSHRHDAHRRYLGWGLRISAFHFVRQLT